MIRFTNQLVSTHVERWAKENSHTFAAGRAIDAQAVYRSKPVPDALFNANPDGCEGGVGGGSGNVTRYESHAGPVLSLTASPFHRHLFLSAGADGMLKVSSLLQHKPLLCLDPAGIVGASLGGGGGGGGLSSPTYGSDFAGASFSGGGGASLHDAQWSKTRPLVFAAAGSNGYLYIYDLDHSLSVPIAEIKSPAVQYSSSSSSKRSSANDDDYDDDDDGGGEEKRGDKRGGSSSSSSAAAAAAAAEQQLDGGAAVHACSFNPKMRAFLCFGDAAGAVHVVKVAEELANVRPAEEQELRRVAASLMEEGEDDEAAAEALPPPPQAGGAGAFAAPLVGGGSDD